MYETAPVIMVVQPTTSLNQRENHPGGTSMTFLFASCKVTDVIANRSKEVVNAGDLVTIAENMYFESSERLRDVHETGNIKPNALYPLDTLMIQDVFFSRLKRVSDILFFAM